MQGRARHWQNVLSRGLLASVALLPWLPALTENVWGLSKLGHLVEVWFAFQCHREPDRMLVGLTLVPVCARCFGIYTGLGLGALVSRPRLSNRPLFVWVAVAGVLMILDVVTEMLALRPPSSLLRLATGLLLSWPVGSALALTSRRRDPASVR